MEYIKKNLEKIEQHLSHQNITLVGVTKTWPVSELEKFYALGYRDFGENKVQELLEKIPQLPKDIRWHFIGHLQRNKVKDVIDKVHLIHSLDSLRLAKEIEKEGRKKNCIVNALVQVNIAGEESKFGLQEQEVLSFLEEVSSYPHLKIKGLMTIPPNVKNPEENRSFFANLYNLYVDIAKKSIDNVDMSILSMGMSNDYTVAIEEGATMVRIGTGIFGSRKYSN